MGQGKIKKYLGIAWFFCLSSVWLYGQAQKMQPLDVGDTISWDISLKMFNYPVKETSFSDFKGKHIIIDFWSKSCVSCIAYFPKMQALQDKFRSQLRVILANSKGADSETQIDGIYAKYRKIQGKPLGLPTIIENVDLSDVFPHRSVPHYVWIAPDGTVQAITDALQINDKNIESFIDGTLSELPQKIDIDKDAPLYSGDFLPIKKMEYYSVLLKGYISGLGSGQRYRKKDGIIHGKAMYNKTAYEIYWETARKLIDGITTKQMLLDVQDSSKLFRKKALLSGEEWGKHNLYTIDVIVPVGKSSGLFNTILDMMNNSTDYCGRVEKRRMRCGVIKKKGGLDSLSNSQSAQVVGQMEHRNKKAIISWQAFVNKLNSIVNSDIIFIDESGYMGAKGTPATDVFDIATLSKSLETIGLNLIIEEREIEVFVLKDKNYTPSKTLTVGLGK